VNKGDPGSIFEVPDNSKKLVKLPQIAMRPSLYAKQSLPYIPEPEGGRSTLVPQDLQKLTTVVLSHRGITT